MAEDAPGQDQGKGRSLDAYFTGRYDSILTKAAAMQLQNMPRQPVADLSFIKHERYQAIDAVGTQRVIAACHIVQQFFDRTQGEKFQHARCKRGGRLKAQFRAHNLDDSQAAQYGTAPHVSVPEAGVPDTPIRSTRPDRISGATDHRDAVLAGEASVQHAQGVVLHQDTASEAARLHFGFEEREIFRPICTGHVEGAADQVITPDPCPVQCTHNCLFDMLQGAVHAAATWLPTVVNVATPTASEPQNDPIECRDDRDGLGITGVNGQYTFHLFSSFQACSVAQ